MLVAAAAVPGGVAAFQIANNFIQLPVALSGGSLAVVQLPRLSRSLHEGLLSEFASTYVSAIRLVIFMVLPASLLLLTISHTLAQAVAFGRMASPAGISLIGSCVAGMALGALGEAIILLATSVSYVRRDTAAPLLGMAIRLLITLIGVVLAQTLNSAPGLMWGLGATVTATNLGTALYLHRSQIDGRVLDAVRGIRDASGNLFAAALAMVPAWLVAHAVVVTGPAQAIGVAFVATLLAIATYLALQFTRGSEEMALLLPLRPRRGLPRRCDRKVPRPAASIPTDVGR